MTTAPVSSSLWVKVEVEGQDHTMMMLNPGSTYTVTLSVAIPAGVYWEDQVKMRRLRLTVPQEGVPQEPPPWEDEDEDWAP